MNIKFFIKIYAINLLILILLSNNFFQNFSDYLSHGEYYLNGFQGMCKYIWEKNPISSVFYQHSQTPLYPLLVGLALKLKLYPILLFLINTILSSFNIILINRISLSLNLSILIRIFLILLYLFNPINIYLQFLSGWELMFHTLVLSLTLKILDLNKDNLNYKNYIFIASIICLMVYLRSTISIPFLLLISIFIFLLSNRKLYFKYYFLPVFLLTFALFFKNYLNVGYFKNETQGILHLGFSHYPLMISDVDFYNSLDNKTKNFFKSGRPALTIAPTEYKKLGFENDNLKSEIYFKDNCNQWSNSNMADVSFEFSKILKHSIFFEYGILKNINFLKTAYEKFWYQVEEYHKLWSDIPKLRKPYDKIRSSEIQIGFINISIKNIFILTLIYSGLYSLSILLIDIVKRKKNRENIVFLIIVFLISYTVFSGIVTKAANFRYRALMENYYFFFMAISIIPFFSKRPILIFNKMSFTISKYILISLVAISLIIFDLILRENLILHNEKVFFKSEENLVIFNSDKENNRLNDYLKKDNFIFITGEIYEPIKPKAYFTRHDSKISHQINNFHISKNELSVDLYMNFVSETKSNFPIWYDQRKNFNQNLELFKKDYLKNLPVDNLIPITGISYENAINFTKWISKKTGKKISIPSNHEWTFAASKILNEKEYRIFNLENKDEIISKSKFHPGTSFNNKNGYHIIGNNWEFVKPNYGYLFTLEQKTHDIIDLESYRLNKSNIYLYPSKKFAILKGGSINTLSNTNELTFNLYIGKKIQDEDFSLRLICYDCWIN